MIKNFGTWFRAWFRTLMLPQKIIVILVIGALLVTGVALIGKLLKFLLDAVIVYGIQLSCMIIPLVVVISLINAKAGKEVRSLISGIFGAIVIALVKAIKRALGFKEPKKKGDKGKKPGDGGDDDDDDS